MGAEVVNEDQKAIIAYIKEHFVGWLEEKNIIPFPQRTTVIDTQLLERKVRVEEAIKRQNDKFDYINHKFEHMDEKFEHMNEKFDILVFQNEKQFEAIERRFGRQSLYQLATFTAIVGSAVAIILKG